ncbi:FAD-dependent monooxygenase [Actinomadura namibiensis]|uniref:2-polyprenyl-6-methoxyphenol hydroxylase-like FAD-dependent oxidoreductase n=1 Tax=Actinomadura namibiensis TaxID=182080 RepID=A0A7W3LR17_ACTNM|nr:FAD-dependent monooxygenase [Actinomadura namibiensis]MBA8952776.1 2-polyprenyl-6-methoxyphenol hydroxylase-like FAD-dependent oxidoreductase [Actinomadura namibiensis]
MTEVIVVGAGPTGLLLAGDLAEAGVAVTVLERRDGEISNLSRAFVVHARTLEQLDARGLAEALTDTGTVLDGLRLFGRVRVDLSMLPSRFPHLVVTPQYNVERLLLERALRAGAEVVHNAEVVGLSQDGAGVTVTTNGGTYRAAYVVGADGMRSAVRHLVGLPFPGRSVLRSIMLADVKVAREPDQVLTADAVGDAFAFIAPFGDGYHRVFAWDRRRILPDDAPLALDEVREATRRALGDDFGMHDPRWLSRFHSDERQAPRYRVGRVFLAGDAAHVHSPAGGMGMNTGLQDAANLGWKLAAALRGAPDALLDSYQDERHPVGRSVLHTSGAIVRVALVRSSVGRVLRGLLGQGALAVPAVRARAAGRISGVGFAYRAPAGAHRLVGTRAPDVRLAGGGRLYEALRGGRFVLVGDADVTGWEDRVRVAGHAGPGGSAVLVRPDGHVGWAGTDAAGLRRALTALAGAPMSRSEVPHA